MNYFTRIVDNRIKFMIPLMIGGIRTLAVVFSPEKCTDTKEVIHA